MIISTVKHFDTCVISKRKLAKTKFGKSLSVIADIEELKNKIVDVQEHNGRVYGIYHRKELVGVYLFERQEDYFIKTDSGVIMGGRVFEIDKFWYGTGTAALVYVKSVCSEELCECREKIEKDIRIDLKEQIEWGQLAGVEWEDELMYRKNLQDEKNKVGGMVPGYLLGFAIGFVLGYVTMDSLTLGICFGGSFACLWGNIGVALARGAEIETLNFIRRKEKENATV